MDILSIKEVVKNGVAFLKNLYEDADNILVEEVEMDDQQQYWFITLSYKLVDAGFTTTEPTTLQSFLYPGKDRSYKTLKIDAKTGAVLSMKIRELQG
ncbi:hypothetical protein [Spirosoma arcticum]